MNRVVRTMSEVRAQLAAALASDDRGSGSVLALAVVCGMLTVAAGGAAVVGAAAAHARAAAAADLAALAGADVAGGRVGGVPCDVAREVALVNGAELAACDQLGMVVTVTACERYLGLDAAASARAGPPDG